jgi:nicotinate-nucleotide--dimethylbenzimidazole phosphoribosyltransferase
MTVDDLRAVLRDPPAADTASRAAAMERQATLTKPAGSLGRLEEIAAFFAGWSGDPRPRIRHGRAAIFAANHGVVAQGVSAYPATVTAQMVANFNADGAAINALARAAGLELVVVPLSLDRPTADFTTAPAMNDTELADALAAGAAVVVDGIDLLVIGEMGIGNTTAAAAICARIWGGGGAQWVGSGTGLDDAGMARKAAVVDRALAFHGPDQGDPFDTLARVGGREIAAIAGAVLAARAARVPVMLDGFISCAAVAPLARANPAILDHCLAGHCSAERGHAALLGHLGLDPLLRLDMRLGEGSGAALAVNIVRSALAVHDEMASFAEAAVATATS